LCGLVIYIFEWRGQNTNSFILIIKIQPVQLYSHAKKEKKTNWLLKQVYLSAMRHWLSKVFKFGIEIPYDFEDAERLDHENGNTFWKDARALEMKPLLEKKTFQFLRELFSQMTLRKSIWRLFMIANMITKDLQDMQIENKCGSWVNVFFCGVSEVPPYR
jgi:hypothetical protein